MRVPSQKRQRAQPPSVSPTIAKLIAQIHAEAQAQTLSALSSKDGILVLHEIDASSAQTQCDGVDLNHEDAAGNRIWAFRRLEEPESWRNATHMAGRWHPAHWSVHVERHDGNGQKWTASLGRHVIDDFGFLVSIEGGKR